MKTPIVIAHRGASAYVPEHTLMAKAIAHALGADYLEQDLDVHPWTFRADSLPKNCPSSDAMLDACYKRAKIDGLFADQPDLAVQFLRSANLSE